MFSPQLSWSRYRALMRVEATKAREFYEHEAIAGGWNKRTLERQIHSFYHERLLKVCTRKSCWRKDGISSPTPIRPSPCSRPPTCWSFSACPR